MDKTKLLLGLWPFIALATDGLLGISGQMNQPQMALALLLAAWMVSWWIFEVVPLGVTALVPLFYLPVMQLGSLNEITPAYSNPVIYLFLGGFIIARALEKTHLDERIALNILKITGRTDRGIIAGFIIGTAGLSMWISNTATAVMMVPIAFSVTQFLRDNLDKDKVHQLASLQVVLFLSIAYAANIGGIMTPIGTPPNVVFMGYLSDLYQKSIDFWLWFVVTAPAALLLLYVMFRLLSWIYPYNLDVPKSFHGFIKDKIKSQGGMSGEQKITVAVFLMAAFLWIFKGLINFIFGTPTLNDTSIAIFAGVLLFLLPSTPSRWRPILTKDDISQLPWDIVLLFGGGMALAGSLQKVGLIEQTTDLLSTLQFSHPYFLILVIAAVSLVMTEIMSNVAFCVVALPMIMKLGEAQGIDPILIALPATLCSSFAFSMPVSTPPNAVVFGTGAISVQQMLKAGILLNALAVGITMTVGYYLIQLFIV
jgi:solute carrier family 13 (sodium-dependent dicarboxylate transporter), member 2/3/5